MNHVAASTSAVAALSVTSLSFMSQPQPDLPLQPTSGVAICGQPATDVSAARGRAAIRSTDEAQEVARMPRLTGLVLASVVFLAGCEAGSSRAPQDNRGSQPAKRQ